MNFLPTLQHVYRETKFLFPENTRISLAKRLFTVILCLPFLRRASAWLESADGSNPWYSKAFKHASYDTMWLEHGGKKTSHNFFMLPSRMVKRAEANTSVRKRVLYKRRYQFIDELQLLLRGVIASPPPNKHQTQ